MGYCPWGCKQLDATERLMLSGPLTGEFFSSVENTVAPTVHGWLNLWMGETVDTKARLTLSLFKDQLYLGLEESPFQVSQGLWLPSILKSGQH